MILAPFLEKPSLDRAPGRFADNLFVRKHAKADVLLTTVMGLLRWDRVPRSRHLTTPYCTRLLMGAADISLLRASRRRNSPANRVLCVFFLY